jgi:hypothetical protein
MSQKIVKNTPEELVIAKVDHQTGRGEPNGIRLYFRRQPHPTDNPTLELVDPRGKTVMIDKNTEAEYYFTGSKPGGVDTNGILGGTIAVLGEWLIRNTPTGDILRDPVRRAKLFADMGISE